MSQRDRVYLDWNATAPMLPAVRRAMAEALESVPGNASSVHQEGQRARTMVESARRSVAEAVGAHPQGVVLTAGATESNNQVLHSHAARVEDAVIACSEVEHPSVVEVVERMGERGEAEVTTIDVQRDGALDTESLDEALNEGATLVSVMLANNETGVTYPVDEIAERVREAGAEFHVDATQALGRMPVDFESTGADYMTLSFHKMGGPKGIGATVVREERTVDAWMAGGHQERGRRAGTENVPAAAGLEAAADCVTERLDDWIEQLDALRAAFRARLDDQIGRDVEVELRGRKDGLANTLNLAFGDVDGEDLLMALDLEGVAASSGSACTAGSLEPSHVILAMGYDRPTAKQSVRFSFGPTLEKDCIRKAADRVGRVVQRLASA